MTIGRGSGLYSVTSLPPGAMALLAGAVSYALSVCGLVAPGELGLPTPCAEWDLGMLLAHLSASMADLEAALGTGHLDLGLDLGLDLDLGPWGPSGRMAPAPHDQAGDPVELIRDRAAGLLCAVYGYPGPGRFITVGGLPVPAGLVACTGAVEIAVHGWDVAVARSRGDRGNPQTPIAPIPAALATRLLRVCPLLVAGREGLFALPVEVPAQASPGDRLVGYLGRQPRLLALVLADPVRTPEEAAQPVVQAMPRVGQCVRPVHRRAIRRRQLASLGVVHGAPDAAPGDLGHLIGVDEAQAAVGGDHDPVEDIDFGDLQHVLEGADRGAGAAQHRRPPGGRLIRNGHVVIAHTGIMPLPRAVVDWLRRRSRR